MHWQTEDHKDYFPRNESHKCDELPPGVYKINRAPTGEVYFTTVEEDSDLIRFDDTIIEEVVEEIHSFWDKQKLFERHHFPFRRGILFHGPPGSGKSCAVKMILQDVAKRGGIGLICNNYNVFNIGMSMLRTIQPETPVVVVMEDLDNLLEYYDQSEILNMLDGIGGFHKVVFLATTNYLKELAGRVKNRPSRFDRCIEIDYPSELVRQTYLEHLIKQSDDFSDLPTDKWARDSKGLSMAHLKELFISVAFFDADYKDVITRLQRMGEEEEESEDSDADE